jgi:hypothetical protein
MMESKVAGAAGTMEDLVSIYSDGIGKGSALEALRAFSDNCDIFITMNLRRAGPSKG